MKLVRVFPRRTRATPIDDAAFVGEPPMFLDGVSEVHVSCAFTWDKAKAQRLAKTWQFRFPHATVRVGGPAFGDAGGEFTPGMYLRPGYVITSRGCPNKCRRCKVPGREGAIRLLRIHDGWDVLDNNLLGVLDLPDGQKHLAAVLAMLRSQPHRPRFTGGLEASRFTRDIAVEILATRPQVMFFAYDRQAQREAVEQAFALLYELTGWTKGTFRHRVGCYVLCGYEGDELWAAEQRIKWVIGQGARAYPMYWRDDDYTRRPKDWHDLVGGTMAFGGRR